MLFNPCHLFSHWKYNIRCIAMLLLLFLCCFLVSSSSSSFLHRMKFLWILTMIYYWRSNFKWIGNQRKHIYFNGLVCATMSSFFRILDNGGKNVLTMHNNKTRKLNLQIVILINLHFKWEFVVQQNSVHASSKRNY